VEITRVVNIRSSKYDYYIGRPSMLGNPFRIGQGGSREEVIQKFREYFYARIDTDCKFRELVLSLAGKILGCYCKPKACHGDIIAEYLNGML